MFYIELIDVMIIFQMYLPHPKPLSYVWSHMCGTFVIISLKEHSLMSDELAGQLTMVKMDPSPRPYGCMWYNVPPLQNVRFNLIMKISQKDIPVGSNENSP